MNGRLRSVICRVTDAVSSPIAIVVLPPVCFGMWAAGIGVELMVFALSVFALSYAQMIILRGEIDTRAIQAKLDALVIATPDAPDELAGSESSDA